MVTHKRITTSKQTGQPIKLVPHIDLGVSMGLISGTDKTQWLLSNSLVVPRIPIGPLLPETFIPFNWKAKTDHPTIQPSIPQILSIIPTSLKPEFSSLIQPYSDPIPDDLIPPEYLQSSKPITSTTLLQTGSSLSET
jgi:hypothetical protein